MNARFMELQQKLDKINRKKKEEKLSQEMIQCTFSPQLIHSNIIGKSRDFVKTQKDNK